MVMKKQVQLEKIILDNKLKVLSGTKEKISQTIVTRRGINKGGMELLGFFYKKNETKILCLGSKESFFINSIKKEEQKKIFKKIFALKTPCILISRSCDLPKLFFDMTKEKDTIVLKSKFNSSDTIFDLSNYLNSQMSKFTQHHATLVEVYGKGILITGKSGIGKSETTLELIKKGHLFISDDGTNLHRVGSKIIGRCPRNILNKLEVRGIGIIEVDKMFGSSVIVEETKVDYVMNLKELKKGVHFDRLGMKLQYETFQEIEIPKIDIPISFARNSSNLIEIAVSQLRLKEKELLTKKEL